MARMAWGAALALLISEPAAAAPLALRTPPSAAVDGVFARFDGTASPGCAIGVDHDHKTVLARAYGMADLEHAVRNTPDTVFEAGSVSKQFTAAAVLALVDAGKLRLDTDVRTVIPELPDYGRTITIDQLLNHTSGLRDWGGIAGLAGWPRTTRAYSQADALTIIVRQQSLNYEPGAESSYTNSGYNLLTEIVRRISGKSLAAFTHDTFFVPLGMTHTAWRDDFRRIVPGRAQAYERDGDRYVQEMPFEDAYGNGGLLTTISDLLIWNRALDDGRLGAFVTKKLAEPSRLNDGRTLTYGRGLFNYTFRGVAEVAHAGSTAGYRAWLGRYPAGRLSIAMLCNAANADTGMGRQVAALYLPDRAEPPRPAKTLDGLFVDRASGIPLDPARYASTESRRVSPDRIDLVGRDNNISVFLRTPPIEPATIVAAQFFGRYASREVGATYEISASPRASAALSWRIIERPDFRQTLAPIYRDAFQAPGGLVRFVRDPTGRVVALTISVERARNVRFDRIP